VRHPAIKRDEKILRVLVSTIFPDKKLLFNAKKSVDLISPLTGHHLEIDIWIPELKLGFEYQVFSYVSLSNLSIFLLHFNSKIEQRDEIYIIVFI
jgi:hypothetical protein